jgi:4-amino-4-deoxy-L-arabinose transferase-like glycosyltransferase
MQGSIVISFFALALRLCTLWPVPPLGADEIGYHALAVVLVQTGNYSIPQVFWEPLQGGKPGDPTAFRTPAFPAFVAAHYLLLGQSDLPPRMTLIGLDVANCFLLVMIGWYVFGSSAVGLTAGMTWAAWPPALFSGYRASSLMPETLGTFFLLACVLVLARLLHHPSKATAVGAGLLLGLGILTRGYVIVAAPLLAFWIMFLPHHRMTRLLLFVCFTVGTGCFPGLWTLRNWHVLGRAVLSTQTEHLYTGNNDWARGSMRGDIWELGTNAPQLKVLEAKYPGIWETSELKRSNIWLQEGRACVLANSISPYRFAWLHGRKALLFLSPMMDWKWGWYRFHYAYALALLLAGIGFMISIRTGQWREGILLVLPFFAAFLIAQIAYAHDRMRYPFEPFVVVLGAFGLIHLFNRGRQKSRKSFKFSKSAA